LRRADIEAVLADVLGGDSDSRELPRVAELDERDVSTNQPMREGVFARPGVSGRTSRRISHQSRW